MRLKVLGWNAAVAFIPVRSACRKRQKTVDTEQLRSMKANGGQGLASMEHTAAKYGGTAGFRFQKPLFHTRISLVPDPSNPDSGSGTLPEHPSASREA